MPITKLVTPLGVECALDGMDVMRITQGMNGSYSHLGTKNIDRGGKPGVKDAYRAPSKAKVVKVAQTSYGEVIIWSVDPVQWADGSVDHYTMRLLHDSAIMVRVGQILEQGQVFYHEGGMGPSGPSTYGIHIHMNVARGHTTKLIKMASGHFQLANSVAPHELLFVNGVEMIDGFGYPWKTYTAPAFAEMRPVDATAFQTGEAAVRIRQKPSVNYPQVGLVPKNTRIDNVTEVSVAPCDGYDWVKLTYNGVEGYCAVVEGCKVINLMAEIAVLEGKLKAAELIIKSQGDEIAGLKAQVTALQKELASFVPVTEAVFKKV